MNVTFMIGNGFDINLGLKTKYSDFLHYYTSAEMCHSNSTAIAGMKLSIALELENWSDFELAFGKYSAEISSNEAYRECLVDILDKLTQFIHNEEKKFDEDDVPELLDHMVTLHTEGLKPRVAEEFRDTNNVYTYNFINFNYTNTLSRLIRLSKEASQMADVPCYLNEPLHIHRKNNGEIIFGVNDESQISNSAIFKDCPSLSVDFLKPELTKYTNEGIDEQCIELLQSSDIIYIYGMSLGKTDKIWWQRAFSAVLDKSAKCIIINAFEEAPRFNRLLGEEKTHVDNYRNRILDLLDKTNLQETWESTNRYGSETFDNAMERAIASIHVVLGQNIFSGCKGACTDK